MKNLKSKLAAFLSASLIFTSFVIPTAAEIEWTTYYEKNFVDASLTAEALGKDGWVFRNYAPSSSGMVANKSNSGMVFNHSLGENYRVTARLLSNGCNGSVIRFNGLPSGNNMTKSSSFNIDKVNNRNVASLDYGNKTGVDFSVWSVVDLVLTVEDKDVKAEVYDTSGNVIDTLTKTYSEEAIGGRYIELGVNSYESVQRWQNVKIEVPKTAVTMPSESMRAAEKPIEITFGNKVDLDAVKEAISIYPETADPELTLSEDKTKVYVAYPSLTAGVEYTLTLSAFNTGFGMVPNDVTYTFTPFSSVLDTSGSFKNLVTVKSGESLSAWIKLSDSLSPKSVKLCTGDTEQNAVYNSETGAYAAEIPISASGKVWFEVTDGEDFQIKIYSKHDVVASDYTAAPVGFFAEGGTEISSMSDITDGKIRAEFDTDLTDTMTIICLYAPSGAMEKTVLSKGKIAVLSDIPSGEGYKVKAMLVKSLAEPSLICGGLELN